jgi:metal-responsive CopG/Arc/MetJ family transcriptional regulator
MKTIQVIVDDPLLKRIDRKCGSRNRSAFFRQAAELLLRQYKIKQLEQDDIEGYKRHPIRPGEFDVWYSEQTWPK